jgi:hypothetical protein
MAAPPGKPNIKATPPEQYHPTTQQPPVTFVPAPNTKLDKRGVLKG